MCFYFGSAGVCISKQEDWIRKLGGWERILWPLADPALTKSLHDSQCRGELPSQECRRCKREGEFQDTALLFQGLTHYPSDSFMPHPTWLCHLQFPLPSLLHPPLLPAGRGGCGCVSGLGCLLGSGFCTLVGAPARGSGIGRKCKDGNGSPLPTLEYWSPSRLLK